MNCLELFKDFMSLGYLEGQRQETLEDIGLTDTVFLRKTLVGNTIYYMTNGSSLFMPWVWCNIFHQFYIYSGCRDGEYVRMCSGSDSLEDFIALSTESQLYTTGVLSRVNGSKYLELMGRVCEIGTTTFREWILEQYNIRMQPFEYRAVNNNYLEI